MALRWVRPTTYRWSRWFLWPAPSPIQNFSARASAWSTAARNHPEKCWVRWRSTRDQELGPWPSSRGNASWAARPSTSSARASRLRARHRWEHSLAWPDRVSGDSSPRWVSLSRNPCWACTREASTVALNEGDWGLEWSLTLLFEVADEVWLGAEAAK